MKHTAAAFGMKHAAAALGMRVEPGLLYLKFGQFPNALYGELVGIGELPADATPAYLELYPVQGIVRWVLKKYQDDLSALSLINGIGTELRLERVRLSAIRPLSILSPYSIEWPAGGVL